LGARDASTPPSFDPKLTEEMLERGRRGDFGPAHDQEQ
jgi:hypothetical protein